jgi:hypothetical protein
MTDKVRPGDVLIYRKATHGKSPSFFINAVESAQQVVDGAIHAAIVRFSAGEKIISVNVDASGVNTHHIIDSLDDVDICIRRLSEFTISPVLLDRAIQDWWARLPKDSVGKSDYAFFDVGVAAFWKFLGKLTDGTLWRRRLTGDSGKVFCSESVLEILQQATDSGFNFRDPINGMPISADVATPGDLLASRQFFTVSPFGEVRA